MTEIDETEEMAEEGEEAVLIEGGTGINHTAH